MAVASPGGRHRSVLTQSGGLVYGFTDADIASPERSVDGCLETKTDQKVIVRSDQGSQFTSHEWRAFLTDHNLGASMSRRGNCYDNAVAESFFHLLKTERIRRKTYKTRREARLDVFDYIEIFDNPKRRHANNGMLSPVEFEMTTK